VGYTLPARAVSKIGLQMIRVYVSGQNLLTWTKDMKDFDPEASQQQGQFYPQQKVITLGLNVTF
jgi:hypothetical protein